MKPSPRALVCLCLLASTASADDSPSITAAPAGDKPTGTFGVGVGHNPDEGFIVGAQLAQDDLFGTGHRLAMSAELSRLGHEARMQYVARETPGRGFELSGELFARGRTYDAFDREGVGGTVGLGRWLDRHTRVDVRFRAEHVTLDRMSPLATSAVASPMSPLETSGTGWVNTLGAALTHDTLDSRVAPRRGSRLELAADVSDPRLGSSGDASFARFSGALTHAAPLGPFTVRLHGRATYLHALAGGIPLSERLQHDGHADIRGYPLGSLGTPGGHDLEALGRIELEAPLVPALGLAVAGFADAGLVHDRSGPAGATLARSVGLSLLWHSPIGALRFDWAIPLDGRTRAPHFLFGLGSIF
jgi:outer membrane protein insertion porin family